MLNDDQNRNRTTGLDPNRRDSRGNMMWALIAAAVVFGLLFMWAPWNGPRIADNTAPGTTTGSSTTRPAAPTAPTAPAPAAPATNR